MYGELAFSSNIFYTRIFMLRFTAIIHIEYNL